MKSDEIYEELQMNYSTLCDYLVTKYGEAPCDYFISSVCKTRNPKVGRGNEGLYCHHRDEDKGGNLSSYVASKQPFEWQKADRLVYCNCIEHLILHAKIAVLRQKDYFFQPSDIYSFFSTGGFIEICQSINSLYNKQGGTEPFLKKSYTLIADNYQDYVNILKIVLNYIDLQYIGTRKPKSGIDIQNTHISATDTQEEMQRKNDLFHLLTSSDWYDIIATEFATNYEGMVCTPLKKALVIDHNNSFIEIFCKVLDNDFIGYGFPQFRRQRLDKNEFGSWSADQYISKAFPSHIQSTFTIKNEKPIFWKGVIDPKVLHDKLFYIARIKAAFQIKEGYTPFIYNRNAITLDIDNENNFLYRHGKIVSVSNIPIELTLTKEDLQLFHQQHKITMVKCLDGCYFKNK